MGIHKGTKRFLIFMMLLLLPGCSKGEGSENTEESGKEIRVIEVKEKSDAEENSGTEKDIDIEDKTPVKAPGKTKSKVVQSEEQYDAMMNSEKQENGEYIISNSNSVYLTEHDISHLSIREVNYAKNEIFARYGRKFKSPELQDYFDSKSWYKGTVEPDAFNEKMFNAYERKNADLLSAREISMQSGGYQLDQ